MRWAVVATVLVVSCLAQPPKINPDVTYPPYYDVDDETNSVPCNVYVGISFNDIQKIEDAEQTFSADFYFSGYWFDPRLDENSTYDKTYNFFPAFDFINIQGEPPVALVADSRDITFPCYPTAFVDSSVPDATHFGKPWVCYNQRFTGSFTTPLDLKDFPFDTQSMMVRLESAFWNNRSVIFRPSRPEAAFVSSLLPPGLDITEWRILGTELVMRNTFYPVYQESYNTFLTRINLKRLPDYYMLKFASGAILLVYMCIAIFMLEVQEADRMMGTLSVFLALISFVFVATQSIPRVAYQTRIDQFFFFSFLMTFIMMFLHAVFYYFRPEEKEEGAGGGYEAPGVEMGMVRIKSPQDLPSSPQNAGDAQAEAGAGKEEGCGKYFVWFTRLHLQRKMDVVAVIALSLAYAIGVGVILQDPNPI